MGAPSPRPSPRRRRSCDGRGPCSRFSSRTPMPLDDLLSGPPGSARPARSPILCRPRPGEPVSVRRPRPITELPDAPWGDNRPMLADPVLIDDWHVVAYEENVPEGRPVGARLLDEDIVLWRVGEAGAARRGPRVH